MGVRKLRIGSSEWNPAGRLTARVTIHGFDLEPLSSLTARRIISTGMRSRAGKSHDGIDQQSHRLSQPGDPSYNCCWHIWVNQQTLENVRDY
jgi:hypothetical protein